MSDRSFWEKRAVNAEIDFGGPSPYVAGPGREFLFAPGCPDGQIDLLDAGCWKGRNEEVFDTNGHTVVGVDIFEAAAAVMVARQRFPGVGFHLAPANALPFLNRSVRRMLDWRRLHNLELAELFIAMRESHRVMVKGGRLLVAVRGHLVGGPPIDTVTMPDGLGGYRTDLSFSKEGWRELAVANGFDTITCVEITEGRCRNGVPSSTTKYLVAHCVKVRDWVRTPQLAI